MESLAKILELAAKYAWAVFATASFLLLLSDATARQLGLDQLRVAYRGQIWLVLVFTAALVVGTYLRPAGKLLWRYVVCPLRKYALPVKDLRTGIKQSRRRYYRIQFKYPDGREQIGFQEVSSNGTTVRFLDTEGNRLLPEYPNGGWEILDAGAFHVPAWAKMDWSDLFNGNMGSGCWGIGER